ncbi:hypothetical protein ABIC21_000505 [Pseudarthrobacter sp. PvP090]
MLRCSQAFGTRTPGRDRLVCRGFVRCGRHRRPDHSAGHYGLDPYSCRCCADVDAGIEHIYLAWSLIHWLDRGPGLSSERPGCPASVRRSHKGLPGLLRISCHVMQFPPHSSMNRHQGGSSGPAATRSKESSTGHVVRGPSQHEVVNAKPHGRTNKDEHPKGTPQGGTRSAAPPRNQIGRSSSPHTRNIRSEASVCTTCTLKDIKKPLNSGNTLPEVGLEPDSSP